MEEILEKHREFLVDRIDPDFGMLDKLLASSTLTKEELQKIKLNINTTCEKNRILLGFILTKKKANELVSALRDSRQTHLANYLNTDGGYGLAYGDDWPLSDTDLRRLDINRESLMDILDTSDLCIRLFSEKVINDRQKQFIYSKPTNYEKNEALLDILSKFSLRQYKKTIACMNDSNQSHIADLLSGGGVLVRVHANLEADERNVDALEDEIINQFRKVLENRPLDEAIRLLDETKLGIITVKKGHSIVIYINCKKRYELLQLTDLLMTNKLKEIVERVFIQLLPIGDALRVSLTWSAEEFKRASAYYDSVYVSLSGDLQSRLAVTQRPTPLSRESVENSRDKDWLPIEMENISSGLNILCNAETQTEGQFEGKSSVTYDLMASDSGISTYGSSYISSAETWTSSYDSGVYERPRRGLKLKRRENIQPSEETRGSHQNTNNERGGKLPDIPESHRGDKFITKCNNKECRELIQKLEQTLRENERLLEEQRRIVLATGSASTMDFEIFDFDSVTTISNLIDSGAYGGVYGPFLWNSKRCAVKRNLIHMGNSDDLNRKLDSKRAILTSLKHTNLIEIHHVILKSKAIYVVMDYANGGSLWYLLHKSDITFHVSNWAKQIAEGMLYLHDRDIVHRDLKSSNIVLMDPFESLNAGQEMIPKIADFDMVQEHVGTDKLSLRGTSAYMAPEFLTENWFSKESEVWSYGVVVWEMLTREVPHKGVQKRGLIEKAKSGQLSLPIHDSIPAAFNELLCDCWCQEASGRLLFRQIVDRLSSMAKSEGTCSSKESLDLKPKLEKDLKETGTVLQQQEQQLLIEVTTGSARTPDFETFDFDSVATTETFVSKGEFGEVYGPFIWNNKKCAIKRILIGQEYQDDFNSKWGRVIKIWTSLKHNNVLEIYYVSMKPKRCYIVMDYAGGGTLSDLLHNAEVIVQVPSWARQIAEGMLYLHDRDIVHRDLKSSIILLMEPFDSLNPHKEMTLKIAVFNEVQELRQTTTLSFRGTIAYMAPEVWTTQRFSKASEVWSYGVILWEMLTKKYPHEGQTDVEIILNAHGDDLTRLSIPESIPDEFKELLYDCWSYDTKCRPSFRNIVDKLGKISSKEGF